MSASVAHQVWLGCATATPTTSPPPEEEAGQRDQAQRRPHSSAQEYCGTLRNYLRGRGSGPPRSQVDSMGRGGSEGSLQIRCGPESVLLLQLPFGFQPIFFRRIGRAASVGPQTIRAFRDSVVRGDDGLILGILGRHYFRRSCGHNHLSKRRVFGARFVSADRGARAPHRICYLLGSAFGPHS